MIEKLAEIIRDNREYPHFIGRRAIDKSCGEVVERTTRDFIPADGWPVVETTPEANFAGEATASARAKALSDLWTVRAVLQALREPTPAMLDATSFVAGLDESPRAIWQAMIDAASQ